MLSPYGLEITESCLTCKMREGRIVCSLNPSALQAFERIKHTTTYPKGTVLLLEGLAPRGVFVLCKGQVKLSLGSRDGKTFILKIVEPGEVLGLSATFSGVPYELTAETLGPCQVTFVKREEFLRFLKENPEACFRVAEQLSVKYNTACHELRSVRLSYSARQKLARLLLAWSSRSDEFVEDQACVRLSLTQDEIAQLIGSYRETVTRVFADLRKQRIVQSNGSTLLIRNKESLIALAADR